MYPIISRTLGGLSAAYYIRQLIFGLIFPAFIYFMTTGGKYPIPMPMLLMCAANTLLYPYARFAYESLMRFIIGENVFVIDAIVMLGFKLMMMWLCWLCAMVIAPIGLVCLYYSNSK